MLLIGNLLVLDNKALHLTHDVGLSVFQVEYQQKIDCKNMKFLHYHRSFTLSALPHNSEILN